MGRNNVGQIIVAVGAAHGGAVSASLLAEEGVGGTSIRRHVISGMLQRVSKGIYIVNSLADDDSLFRALQLAYPPGAVCRYSAAARYDFPLPAYPQRQFVVPHGTSVVVNDVLMHETRDLPEVDVREDSGLRVTSPARTLCDIAPELSEQRLRHVVESQLVRKLPSDAALVACLSERLRRGVDGMQDFAELTSLMLDDQPYPESVLEVELLSGLAEVGLEGLVRQFRPSWYDGIRGIVDAADPIGMTIIEADGRGFRKITQAHDNDRQRDRMAAANGYLVVRVGYRELEQRRQTILEEIRHIVESRRAARTLAAA